MAGVFYLPLIGTPTAEGNELSFFEAGTDVPLNVWTDPDLTLAWAQPIVLNAAGESDGPIYVSPSPAYKVVYTDADGVAIPGYPVDFVSPSTIVNVMTTAITTLTNAQIKALPTTPISILAAPATGLRTKVLALSLQSDITTIYTNLNVTYCDLHVSYDTAGPLATVPLFDDPATLPSAAAGMTGLLASGVGTFLADLIVPHGDIASYWTAVTAQTVGSQDAMALYLSSDNNGSGALTGGNAANSLTVTVYYALESV